MASPVAETSETLALVKFGPNGISRGRLMTMIPGRLLVRVGLTRVAADDAAIGIAEFSRAGDRRGTVNFGAHPDWAPQVGIEPIGQVSIGAHVQNGQMKGWFYIQFWA